jgi:hypothetical protein
LICLLRVDTWDILGTSSCFAATLSKNLSLTWLLTWSLKHRHFFMQYVWGIWVRVQYGKKWLNGSGMFVRGLILLLRLFVFRGFCKISLFFMVFKWCWFYRRVGAYVIWWFLWNRDNRHFWSEWKSFNLTEFLSYILVIFTIGLIFVSIVIFWR